MMRLPTSQMSELLKFGLRLNERERVSGDCLSCLPDDIHQLLQADRSIFCLASGGAVDFRSVVRRIERATPPHRRKWSNDHCVVCSYSVQLAGRGGVGRTILSIGRNYPCNRIVCGMFGRNRDSDSFSIVNFTMSHLAVGYALDSIGSRVGDKGMAIEMMGPERRRLQWGDVSHLSARIDQFLSDKE